MIKEERKATKAKTTAKKSIQKVPTKKTVGVAHRATRAA